MTGGGDLFEQIHRVIPGGQEIVALSAGTPVRVALQRMKESGFNQVPVVAGHEVLGVFSYRSFAQAIPCLAKRTADVLDLEVDNFLEEIAFAHRTDPIEKFIDEFDLIGTVLIGSRDSLSAVVTTIDVLRYFYSVASPYILLREIELSLRELLRRAVDAGQLERCAAASLRSAYEGREIPKTLEDMSFQDYVSLLQYRGTWSSFAPTFGANQDMALGRISSIPALRNLVFHFRRELLAEEYEILKNGRDWLWQRTRVVQASGEAMPLVKETAIDGSAPPSASGQTS